MKTNSNLQLQAILITNQQVQYMKDDLEVVQNCKRPFKNHPEGCPNFNKNWGCPPYAPKVNETIATLSTYPFIYVLYLEMPFKRSGPRWWINFALKGKYRMLTRYFNQFLNYISSKYIDWNVYYCSHCELCKEKNNGKCTCPEEPCRFPNDIRISPEAAGIDVVQTLKNVDIEIDWTSNTNLKRVAICATDEQVNFKHIYQSYLLYLDILNKITDF